MTPCETCERKRYCQIYCNGYSKNVKACRDYREAAPLTNFDRITVTPESLAEFMKLHAFCGDCPQNEKCDGTYETCPKNWLAWLKQESE